MYNPLRSLYLMISVFFFLSRIALWWIHVVFHLSNIETGETRRDHFRKYK